MKANKTRTTMNGFKTEILPTSNWDYSETFYEPTTMIFEKEYCGWHVNVEIRIFEQSFTLEGFTVEGISDDNENADAIYEKIWNWLENEFFPQMTWEWIENNFEENYL